MDMDSAPAATTTDDVPSMMFCAPRMIALRDEAHTLFTVVQMVDWGRPAPMAAWRAGPWPRLGKYQQLLHPRGMLAR